MADQPNTPKKVTVATPSAAYQRMLPKWEMIDTLLGGTDAMRAAGAKYLPQYDAETNRAYQVRLERAVLLNMTEQTLDTLVGKPFREDVVLEEDVPEAVADLAPDIDLQGTNMQAFLRAWFREAWAKGFSHVLVEHPTPVAVTDEQGVERQRTLEDDRKENLRPYWVHIKPESIIGGFTALVDGKETIIQLRIVEKTLEKNPDNEFEELEKTRIRVLEPGVWRLYKPSDRKDEWDLEDEGISELKRIPLVTFYAGKKTGFMECKPPLIDLGHINVSHWQSGSDQRNVLTVARFPILAAAGVADGAKVEIGPNKFLTTEAPTGKWYYVEHTGAAIAAGAADLTALEDQMSTYGAEFMRKRPGNETATGRALDSAESSSYLASTVKDFQDCVELAMQYTADWMNIEDGGSISISDDVDVSEADATELDALNKARAARDISRRAYLTELKARGVLSDDFDIEDDAELLAEEATKAMGDMFGGGNGTQTPPQDPNNPNPADPNNPNPNPQNQPPANPQLPTLPTE